MHYASQLCFQQQKNGKIFSTSEEILDLLWVSWLEVNFEAVIRSRRRCKQTETLSHLGPTNPATAGKANNTNLQSPDYGVLDKNSGFQRLGAVLALKMQKVPVNDSLLGEIVASFYQTVFDAWTGNRPIQSYIQEADQDCTIASYFKAPFKKLLPMFGSSEARPSSVRLANEEASATAMPPLRLLRLGQAAGSAAQSNSAVGLLDSETIGLFLGSVEKKLEQTSLKWDCIDGTFVYIIEVAGC